MRKYARAIVWIFCVCLMGQQALAHAAPSCSHMQAAPVQGDEAGPMPTGHEGHAAHHDTRQTEDAGSPDPVLEHCACGCSCANFACAHAASLVALIGELRSPAPTQAHDCVSGVDMLAQERIDLAALLRPPIIC